ncbi:putative peptidase m24 protein [Phaeoacremonium minimum UCRPA7]|uniref:Putative peptidase m24 protein n=1 Tax=Phaeoacremonium minimum (strain UCR-PA7) TaxID=1286976 RepID=R8BCE4_PHAM7|nr:putative peptidase m24 protein [Phaeoacremonium minimum UCRPA7]EON96971.1 putative peptidase m24 protein [Phaeoacremonium minimum UCRPA7]
MTATLSPEEQARATYLLDAQNKAVALFDEIERDLLRPGVSEKTLSDEIHKLGQERHGIKTHWHKRVIRSGPNTLKPFAENPPDRIIEEDDILYVDLGPVFEEWEADFGRTYVLGNDPVKKRLRDSLEPVWDTVKAHFSKNPDMTGEELYSFASNEAVKLGYKWGAEIAGHIVGSFPHERIPRDKTTLYIIQGNSLPMSTAGKDGHKRHWILEIHLHDPDHGFGGFYEKLLTV